MKKFFLAITLTAIVALSGIANAQAFVQDCSQANGASSLTTVSCTFGSATTTSNTVIVGVLFQTTTTATLTAVTVTNNNSISATIGNGTGGGLTSGWSEGSAIGFSISVWFFPNAASMTSVTATIGSAFSNSRIWALEFSGVATSSPYDNGSGGSGNAAGNLTCSSVAAAQNNEVWVAIGVNGNGTVTTGSGWTTPPNGTAGGEKSEYQIVSAGGSSTGVFGGDGSAWVVGQGLFKGSGAAPSITPVNKRQKLEILEGLTNPSDVVISKYAEVI